MGLRVLVVAACAFIAAGMAYEAQASEGSGYRVKRSYSNARLHRRRYNSSGVGGQAFGYQNEPFINNGSNYNYPGYVNNQTFWERVETQPDYPVR